MTAHVVEMLAARAHGGPRQGRASSPWSTCLRLRSEQEPDGSWFGRWGVNYVYGTGAAIPGAGLRPVCAASDPAIRRGVAFLETHQNDDGGWGEDIRSYDDRRPWRRI